MSFDLQAEMQLARSNGYARLVEPFAAEIERMREAFASGLLAIHCQRCNGAGEIRIGHHAGPDEVYDCPDCSNIRVTRAGAAVQPSAVNDLLTRAEFDAEMLRMEDSLPLLKRLREDRRCARFDGWPERLKADLYKRMGVEPVVMYRRTADKPGAAP